MKNSIARISLIILVIAFLVTILLPKQGESSIPNWIFLSVVSTIVVIFGTKKLQIVGFCCLLFSLTALIAGYHAETELKAHRLNQIESIESTKPLFDGRLKRVDEPDGEN